jgi:hypothetical protein
LTSFVEPQLLHRIWYQPVLARLLENRIETAAIAGMGVLQVGLHLLHLPGWACPIKQFLGIPCPGCGLTTAADLLLHGDISASLRAHAFAGVFLVVLAGMCVALLLPQEQRSQLVKVVERFEMQTGASALFLVSLLVYWLVRLSGYLS